MEVYIRKFKIEDAKISWKWRNDPEIWMLTGREWNDIVTYEVEKIWLLDIIKNDEPRFAICLNNNKYIGNVQLTNLNDEEGEFHIFIGDKKYWGKGIGTKATQLLIDYGFKDLNLKSIYLFVKKSNISAIRVYEKLGFNILRNNNNFLKMEIKNFNK